MRIELYDARDGFALYSCSGRPGFHPGEGCMKVQGAWDQDEDGHYTLEGIDEYTQSFSAASRSVSDLIFPDIMAYLEEAQLRCRITLTSKVTKKMVVIGAFGDLCNPWKVRGYKRSPNGPVIAYSIRPAIRQRLHNIVGRDENGKRQSVEINPEFFLGLEKPEQGVAAAAAAAEAEIVDVPDAEKMFQVVWPEDSMENYVGDSPFVRLKVEGANNDEAMRDVLAYTRACVMGYQGQWMIGER